MTHLFIHPLKRLVLLACLLIGSLWSGDLLAQQTAAGDPSAGANDLSARISLLESELQIVRERLSAVGETGSAEEPPAVPIASPVITNLSDCQCGHCAPCILALENAPCIDCPRVSTISPYFNINVFGALKLDMLFNNARAVSPGTPFFLIPGTAFGFSEDTVSIHARQSNLGAAFTGPKFGGFQSGGMMLAMFFNDNVILDSYGFLPLQAYGELRNDQWRFAAGLQFDVFSPGAPTVLPFSALAASGNSGNSFRGQIRIERFIQRGDAVQWTLQGALSDPITSTVDPLFRLSEDNGWPNVEGRIAVGLGQTALVGGVPKRPFEAGLSGVVGQLRTTEIAVRQVVADVWGVSTDFRWQISPCFGIAGEVFSGQGLGTYNAGILQGININSAVPANSTLNPIRTTGGWIETFAYLTPRLHSHVGFGIDDPVNRDVSVGQRTQNSTVFANCLWDVNQTFRVGVEYTWRKTQFQSPGLNDGNGSGIQTQVQWSF